MMTHRFGRISFRAAVSLFSFDKRSSFCLSPASSSVLIRGFRQTHLDLFKISSSRLDQKSFKNYADEDWRARLSPEQYHVCRERGTEPPWSGELLDTKDPGVYCCVCCDAELFSSSAKFDSKSGWPSFWAAVEHDQSEKQVALGLPSLSVDQVLDHSHGMVRVEVLCKQCNSHLGHVFRDGPEPTGLRYCINSVALKFKPITTKE